MRYHAAMVRNRVCAVLLCVAVSAAAAPASARAFTVVTYNVGLLKVLWSNYVPLVDLRARAAPAELERFAREEKPDILLLEEVWRDGYARGIEDALSPLGYTFAHPDVHSILGLSSGLLLAVRAPLRIVDWKFTPFSKSTFLESFSRKGVLDAALEDGSGSRFAVVGTHTEALDTDNGVPNDKAQVDAHAAQAAQILAAVQSRSGGGALPVLLLGDFNVGPGYADEAYRRIADAPGMREAGAVVSPAAPIITWDPQNPLVKYGEYPNEPPSKIDHVFFRDGSSAHWKVLGARRVLDAPAAGLEIVPRTGAPAIPIPLSDHYGFLATLDLGAAR